MGPSQITLDKFVIVEYVNKSPDGDCGADVFMDYDLYVFEVLA